MPELTFKGKEFVFNHHLAVPFRPLVPDAAKSVGDVRLDGNLVIHGDNLHALRALAPQYAGQVDVVYIDPPYNTGNEGWCYNDNVNSPMIREWLSSNPVGIDDGLRHDKWCSMMYPRLRLLADLMTDEAVIFVSIDDNEGFRLRSLMDEVFGDTNYVATFIWRKVDSPNDNKVSITPDHEYVICYAKDKKQAKFSRLIAPEILDAYGQTDEQGRRYRDRLLKKNGRNSLRRDRPTMFFPIKGPDGVDVYPIHDNGEEACWAAGEQAVGRHCEAGTLIWKQRERRGAQVWEPYTREFAPEVPARPFPTIWADLPTMRQAKAMLRDIFQTTDVFDTPKPVELIQRILELVDNKDALVLDSFAGSGTTAHAVLAQNRKDGGGRRFVLVETEEYADRLTAERVRRVMNGYSYTGTVREELLRERLTFSELRRVPALLESIDALRRTREADFDRIRRDVDGSDVVVTGERSIEARADGIGGQFTYCALGPAVEFDALLMGVHLPSAAALGAVLYHMATSEPINPAAVRDDGWATCLGETSGQMVWLIYRPQLDWLKSRDAALTLSHARALKERYTDKRHLVFAPARFVTQKVLNEERLSVEFAPLPYALFRVDRE